MKKFIILSVAVVILSGCVVQQRKQTTTLIPGAGIFKTGDKGEQWAVKGDLLATGGSAQKFGYANVTFMKFDPQDASTVYVGTENALYYSYSRGEGWLKTLANQGTINDIAIDPQDKCTLYAAVHNKIFKSIDCSRSWQLMHFSSLANQYFAAILVSQQDSDHIFVGASDGALIHSRNAGVAWDVLRYVDSPIYKFVPHPHEPSSFYMVNQRDSVLKTSDLGVTWKILADLPVHTPAGVVKVDERKNPILLGQLPGARTYMDMTFDTSQKDGILYASGYGLFRLIDGEYWQEIEILNKPQQARIFSIAIDGTTGKSLYFATTGAFYRSENGGLDWTVRALPASGMPKILKMAPDNPSELYLAFYAPAK